MGISAATAIGVREAYSMWAPQYACQANPLLVLQERTLEPLLPPLRGRVLVDVACGTGRWLKRLATRGTRMSIGLDFSEPMLRRARVEVDGPNALFCADGCALPFQDHCADVVLCSLALDHVANLASFIYEVARIIKDGGTLLLSDFHPDAHARGWKRSFKTDQGTIELPVYPRHLSTIHEAFRRAGFTLEVCEEPCFGEPDRSSFADAGRENLFEPAMAAGPALYVSRYVRRRRRPSPSNTKTELTLRFSRIATTAHSAARADVGISKGVFTQVNVNGAEGSNIVDLTGYMLLPGLINAHDHLEFSLFPRLGEGPYANAHDWARDIYRPDDSPIREHRRIPKDIRLWWGGLKNLLCGVTTVSHHNPYSEIFTGPDFPVRVVAHYGWAHSFAEEPDVRGRMCATPSGAPFLIHLGEGIDDESAWEFERLAQLDAIDGHTVIVHGVALSADDHQRLQRCGGALVWCPSSNIFLLGRTVSPEVLSRCTRVALGSDSAISGAGDLLDEIKVALSCGVPARRIYDFVTCCGANILQEGAGSISVNRPADLIAVRDRGLSPAETVCAAEHTDIELVIIAGRLRMISEHLLERWPGPLPHSFQPIFLEGTKRYVDAPVSRLLEAARCELGPEIRLAGKLVWQ